MLYLSVDKELDFFYHAIFRFLEPAVILFNQDLITAGVLAKDYS